MVTALFYLFIVIISIQAIYYLIIFGNFSFGGTANSTTTNSNSKTIPVSLIICAKNEAENLKKNLPKFLSQNHPKFEVILINDASYDDTLEIMEGFAEKHSNIRIVNVAHNEHFWGKKKYALTLGIKVTSYEHLVFSDADCYPASNNWLTEIANKFTEEKTIVLGYGAYKKVKNSLLNALIRFETVLTAIQYFAMAKSGNAYMGVGRNLAYKKSEFLKRNGFANHMHIKSGDDDLFINEAATKSNTTVCYTPDSFTYSEPKKTFKSWITQKRRHISTAKYYKGNHKFTLGLFYLSQVLFWCIAIALLITQFQWIIVTALIGFRLIIQYISFGCAAAKLKESKLLWLLPIYELFLICIQFFIFIANIISKPVDWK